MTQKVDSNNRKILELLLNTETVTVAWLSQEIGISEKSVRTKIDIVDVFLQENGLGTIQKKRHFGIWLEANEEQRFQIHQIIQKDQDVETKVGKDQRVYNVLRVLLKNADKAYISTKALSDRLYLSLPTTLKVVQEVKEWLSKYHVRMISNRNLGLTLAFEEVDYRLAVRNFISKYAAANYQEELTFICPGIDVTVITEIILQSERKWNFEFAEDSFQDVAIYISLALHRNAFQSMPVFKQHDIEQLQEHTEYEFAKYVLDSVFTHFHQVAIEEDIAFLTIQLLCSRLTDIGDITDTQKFFFEFNTKVEDFVHKIMEVLSDVLDMDLMKDETLFTALKLHLKPCLFRLKYKRESGSRMTAYLKKEFPDTFRVVWIVSMLIEEYFDLKITEDELSYIVIYIQAAIDRNAENINTVLVSSSGFGINMMLKEKIMRTFPKINIIDIITVHEFRFKKYKNVEMILTLSNLGNESRAVEIDGLLSESSMKAINTKLLEINRKKEEQVHFDKICHQLFDPDLIFTRVKGKSKKEVLRQVHKQLVKKGYAKENFLMTLLDREEKTPTSIGNGVAIPHGSQTEIYISKVCFVTLETPIQWDDKEKVDFIAVLVLKADCDIEIRKMRSFYKSFLELVDTRERVENLVALQSPMDFYKCLIQ